MELVAIRTTELSELIDTVRQLSETVKEFLSSAPTINEPVTEGYVSRLEAMKYLHIKSAAKFIIACKRYDFQMRKIGKRKLFKLSDLENVLKQNNYNLDLSELTQKEKINCINKNL